MEPISAGFGSRRRRAWAHGRGREIAGLYTYSATEPRGQRLGCRPGNATGLIRTAPEFATFPLEWIRDGPDARARGGLGYRDGVSGWMRTPAYRRARGPFPIAQRVGTRSRILPANAAAGRRHSCGARAQLAAGGSRRAGAAVGNIFAAQDRRGHITPAGYSARPADRHVPLACNGNRPGRRTERGGSARCLS